LTQFRFKRVSDGVNVLLRCELCGAMFFTENDAKGHVVAHVKGLLKHRKPPPKPGG